MPFIRLCLALTVSVMLAGCISSGNTAVMDQARLEKITVNSSTKEDVRRLLGQPTTTSKHSGQYSPVPGMPPSPDLTNVEVWSYTHLSVDIDGATFIPIVGLFAGGATIHINTYTAVFDQAGIVRHTSASQSEGRSGPASDGAPVMAETPPANHWANKRSK